MDLLQFFTLLLVVFGAGVIATFATFGFTALFLIPLSLMMPLPQAIAISGIVDLTNGISRGFFFRNKIDWRLVLYYGLPGIIFSLLGALLIKYIDRIVLEKAIGAVLVLYGIIKLYRGKVLSFGINKFILGVGGALTGFLAGSAGAGGALRSAFLSSYKLPVAQFIATTTLIEILVDTTRAISYVSTIQLDPPQVYLILSAIPVSFGAVWLGSRYAKNIPENTFRNILAILMIIFGLMYLLGTIK